MFILCERDVAVNIEIDIFVFPFIFFCTYSDTPIEMKVPEKRQVYLVRQLGGHPLPTYTYGRHRVRGLVEVEQYLKRAKS